MLYLLWMVTETMVGTLVSQEVAREDGTDVMWDALPGTTLAFLQALALAIHMVVTTDIGCVFPYSPQVNLEYDFFFFGREVTHYDRDLFLCQCACFSQLDICEKRLLKCMQNRGKCY